MSNAFARAYYKRIGRGLEVWREWTRADKHREAVLRRTLEHWLKRGGQYLIAVFANWKALAGIRDTRGAIAQADYEMGDMRIVQAGDAATFEKTRAGLIEET